jgi:hypothetical protein
MESVLILSWRNNSPPPLQHPGTSMSGACGIPVGLSSGKTSPFMISMRNSARERKNPTMLVKVKAVGSVIPIILALLLSSCSPSSGLLKTEEVNTAAPSQPLLKTTMGDFAISSARLVDEVHDQKSQPGEEFLLVILTQPSLENLVPGEFSLETFQKMIQDNSGQIFVSGKDGSQFISTMAGWVEDEFAMGFAVPIIESYTLHWPGNPPIELSPKKQ